MWLVGSLAQLVQLVSFDSLLQLVSFDSLIACFSLCYVFVAYHSFAIFGPQYSLSSSKYLPLDMCIAFLSLVEKYTTSGELNLYWSSKLFAHFGNRCQWGRSFREFCGEFQRVISSCFVFVPQHLHLIRMHYQLLHCMVMHNSLYKLS